MEQNKYRLHPFFLHFLESSIEARYRDYILERVLKFTKATWCIVITITIIFSVMDKHFFAENASLVLKLRFGIILMAALMFVASKRPGLTRYMDWNGFIFAFFIGLFANILILLDTTKGFSLWFAGLFFVFPGVFCTAGLGFRHSIFAMISIPVFFEIFYFIGEPFIMNEFMFYNIFLSGMFLIYTFLAYLVENIIRKNYITSQKLKDSLDQIHKLSGLLPMCAKCKKIRNDEGYWQQVETYIQANTEAKFSHGLCPLCMDDMYGDEEWFKKMKESKGFV